MNGTANPQWSLLPPGLLLGRMMLSDIERVVHFFKLVVIVLLSPIFFLEWAAFWVWLVFGAIWVWSAVLRVRRLQRASIVDGTILTRPDPRVRRTCYVVRFLVGETMQVREFRAARGHAPPGRTMPIWIPDSNPADAVAISQFVMFRSPNDEWGSWIADQYVGMAVFDAHMSPELKAESKCVRDADRRVVFRISGPSRYWMLKVAGMILVVVAAISSGTIALRPQLVGWLGLRNNGVMILTSILAFVPPCAWLVFVHVLSWRKRIVLIGEQGVIVAALQFRQRIWFYDDMDRRIAWGRQSRESTVVNADTGESLTRDSIRRFTRNDGTTVATALVGSDDTEICLLAQNVADEHERRLLLALWSLELTTIAG